MTELIQRSQGLATEGPIPPQALDAERSVLAAMMLDAEAAAKAIEMIDANVFYRVGHQKIFEGMIGLFTRNEKIDLITLSEEMRKRGDLDSIGGTAAIAQVLEYASTSANLEQHIRIVHSKSVLRMLIKASTEIQQECYEGGDETPAILDRAEQRIFQITDTRVRQGFTSMKELMMPTMKHIEELAARKAFITGIASGYDDLDKLTAGFQKSDLVIIAGRPSMGKCLAAESELVLDDGSIATIEQVFHARSSRVGTVRAGFRLDRAMPSDYVDDGIKPVFAVTTRLGRRVETTKTHPFLTREGWKPLDDLEVGDHIAVPRVIPVFGTEPMNECEIEQLADLIGETGLTNSAPFTTHAVIDQDFNQAMTDVGVSDGSARAAAPTIDLAPASITAGTKEIPASIFRLPREKLAIFLRHLFETGGSASVSRSEECRLGYSTIGERLARQIQHLLLRFGVIAELRQRSVPCRDGRRSVWRIECTDSQTIRSFIEEIGIFSTEAAIGRARQEITSHRQTHETDFAAAFDPPRFEGLSDGDVYWDRIESIDPMGPKQVYDLTIPETHNFIANDVCVHNTSFAMNIAENAAIQHGKNVAIFSLEMSKEQIALRLLCSQSEVPLYKVRSGHLSEAEFRRLANLTGGLYKASLLIDDTAAPTVLEIRAKCRRLRAENKLDIVMIDYLQLVRSSGRSENRNQEISQITRALKGLAKELDVPIVALSQLSRAPEARGTADKRPQLSDLRESGCLTADTRILRADNGAEQTLGDLLASGERNIPVWTIDDDLRLKRGCMTHVFFSGVKPVFELRLASGSRVKASGNHPFMTLDGWTALDRLDVGSRVAVPRRMLEPTRGRLWADAEVILLAHMIGDGCFASRQPIHYTSASEENLLVVERAASHFGIRARRVRQGNWSHLYLPAPFRLTHGKHNPIAAWLSQLGLYGLRSRQKFIPAEVFALSDSQVGLFIRHLWSTDGCVHQGAQARIYYASSSRRLIDELKQLLLRVGVLSRIKAVHKAGYEDVYHLHVTGAPNQLQFLESIGVHGKDQRVGAMSDHLSRIVPNTNVDTVPIHVWRDVREAMTRNGVTGRALAAGIGMAYCGTTLFKHAPGRERLAKVAELIQAEPIKKLATSDVFWETIVAIEPLGEQPVYDATVPGAHNFIANGILVHNSIEQDADVVLFVFREEMYKKDDPTLRGLADIIIAKQRNGPTGDVKLTFLHEFTKFVPFSPMMPEPQAGF